MLVEHARNRAGLLDAAHDEYGSDGRVIVQLLSCSLVATTIEIDVVPDTILSTIHGEGRRSEHTNCNYGLNPGFQYIAATEGMVVSATDSAGEVRAVERVEHPFFVGTLYQPQREPQDRLPHPLFDAFVLAVSRFVDENGPKS